MRHSKFILFALLCFSSMFAADASIGKVIALEGVVKAISSAGQERALARGSSIFVSETIQSAADAKAQIRFTDGTLLNVNPDSEFQMNAYSYKMVNQPDQFDANLATGGFRFLTGSIAKKNPEEYQMRTPNATLGLRGTIVTVSVLEENAYFGIEQGRALVSNPYGSIMIGEGEKANYSFAGVDRIPEQIVARPPQLNPQMFTPPHGAVPFPSKSAPAPAVSPAHAPPKAAPAPAAPPPKGVAPQKEEEFPKEGGGSAQIHGGC